MSGKSISRTCLKTAGIALNDGYTEGPTIVRSEMVYALLKENNTPGQDGVYAEILKVLNKIYDTGEIPQFVPLPKNANANSDYRLISLMNQALKILLKIIHIRFT